MLDFHQWMNNRTPMLFYWVGPALKIICIKISCRSTSKHINISNVEDLSQRLPWSLYMEIIWECATNPWACLAGRTNAVCINLQDRCSDLWNSHRASSLYIYHNFSIATLNLGITSVEWAYDLDDCWYYLCWNGKLRVTYGNKCSCTVPMLQVTMFVLIYLHLHW